MIKLVATGVSSVTTTAFISWFALWRKPSLHQLSFLQGFHSEAATGLLGLHHTKACS